MRTTTIIFLLFLSLAAAPTANADDFLDGVKAHKQQDYAKAFKLWLPLANNNHLLAQTLIGSMYAYGEGVEHDDAKAVMWFTRAAKLGSAQAQYNLGIMYEKGLGVERDLSLARKWLQAASDQGRKDASSLLVLISDAAEAKLAELSEKQPSTTNAADNPDTVKEINQAVTATGQSQQSSSPATIASSQSIHSPADALGSQQGIAWLRSQAGENYTIQLAASVEERLINAFVKQLALKKDYAHIISKRNGRDWHALVYGSYDSATEARQALKALPEEWRIWQPWIRPIKSVIN